MTTTTQRSKDFAMKTAGSIRPSSEPTPSAPFLFNTRLVAAVQTKAGAHCHESANLLQTYYFCAEVYRVQLRSNDAVPTDAARRSVQQAEVRLRKFLTDLSWPCSCDRHAVTCGESDELRYA
jgi:hypothetical protein